MAYDVKKLATLGQLEEFGRRTMAVLASTFKSAEVESDTVKVYTTVDKSGEPAFSFGVGGGGYEVATDAEVNEMLDKVFGSNGNDSTGG